MSKFDKYNFEPPSGRKKIFVAFFIAIIVAAVLGAILGVG